MAENRDETNVPYQEWDRECLNAARDRHGRRLGDGERKRLGSALRQAKSPAPRHADPDEDVVQLEIPAPARDRRSRSGR